MRKKEGYRGYSISVITAELPIGLDALITHKLKFIVILNDLAVFLILLTGHTYHIYFSLNYHINSRFINCSGPFS